MYLALSIKPCNSRDTQIKDLTGSQRTAETRVPQKRTVARMDLNNFKETPMLGDSHKNVSAKN